MMTHIPKEIERQIITRLENGDDRDDIILDICESRNIDWKNAEALVDSIHAEHADNITLSQSPLLILLALAIFLGGVGLILYAVYDAFSVYQASDWGQSQRPDIGQFEWKAGYGFLIYLVITGGNYFGMLVLGIGMIIGSLRGMQDVWSVIYAQLGIFQDAE